MRILITGGFGNVGRSAVNACLAAGHEVTIFESPGRLHAAAAAGLLRRLIKGPWAQCRFVFGDIRKPEDIERAFSVAGSTGSSGSPGSAGQEAPQAVIHLAALIPPAADRDEKAAWDINAGGTKNLIETCQALGPDAPRLVLASSIAIYGDRLENFWIRTSDPVRPSDVYSRSKVECEAMLRDSGLDHAILRLSYVAWAKWHPFDPLLFAMPPETRIEIIHTEDAGRAFLAAATLPEASGILCDIGGGALCRTSFRAYLDRMFRYFGLGDSSFLDDGLFARSGFHCGWYSDSDEAEETLHFRRKTLEDYYEEVRWDSRWTRPAARCVQPLARRWLKGKSPALRRSAPFTGRLESAGQPRK
jgi:nucleoside-diphosphate-sugar epimerase